MAQRKITGSGIANDAITSDNIAAGVVSASDVADGTLTAAKLAFDVYTQAEVDTAIANNKAVTVGTTEPSSPSEGDLWYDSTVGVKSLKIYNGTEFLKVSVAIPNLTSITGDIYNTVSTDLTLTGQNFLQSNLKVDFTVGGTTTSVTVTPTSDTSATVTVPSAVYNASAGSSVTVKVVNSDGGQSQDLSKTIIGIPSGGTITTSGNYRIHAFTSSSNIVFPTGFSRDCEILVVAGGGGGGRHSGGGGGAGGLLYYGAETPKTPNGSALNITSGTYSVVVGAGGAATTGSYPGGITGLNGDGNGGDGYYGNNSSVFGLVAVGGGGGGHYSTNGNPGGSSGGSSRGNGNADAATNGQGNVGGAGSYGNNNPYPGAGGGGAGGAGQANTSGAQDGGAGLQYSISGSATYYAGGGGGNTQYTNSGFPDAGSGGLGGGGRGAYGEPGTSGAYTATNGTANTGGGGGGEQYNTTSAQNAGGSGIVIVRYQL